MSKFLRLAPLLAALLLAALSLAACGSGHTITRVVTVPQTPQSQATGPATPIAGLPNIFGGRPRRPKFIQGATGKAAAKLTPPHLFSLTPSLSGYDAVTISNLRGLPGVQVIGCYAVGSYANCGTAQIEFPNARRIPIAPYPYVGSAPGAPYVECLDIEPGDASPGEAQSWFTREIAAGVPKPCEYANASTQGQVEQDVRTPHCSTTYQTHCYLRWVAAWDNVPSIPPGFDAKQWRSDAFKDSDSFSPIFFLVKPPKPPVPKVICWGKHSTPTSSKCKTIEAEAKHDWAQYVAFHNGLVTHQKQLARVRPYPGYYQANRSSIHVPAYKGPGIGYLNGRISTEAKWARVYKARHDQVAKEHTA